MNLPQLASTLRQNADLLQQRPVVTGFDGFVDEMITVVEERNNLDDYRRVEDITRFGELVTAAAGHSSLREIVVTRTDPGGCAINMGDGLAALGIPVTTFATVGEPMHAAFNDYAAIASVHSWGREPGRTLAFEFADGKLMFSSVSQLAEFTPQDVERRLQQGTFNAACHAAHLIALTDWTLYPHMTACWKTLQDRVFSQLPHKPTFFLDLVDPVSRSAADILAMLEQLSAFNNCGPTVLGLNQNEANILSKLTGGNPLLHPDKDQAVLQAITLRAHLNIAEVVIHAVDYAASASDAFTGAVDGPFCAKPKKLTGAGDRFNAGYATGLLLDLPPQQRLQLAVATSGFYVRKARSASLPELADFIESDTP